jgi:hypothetical protein
MSILAEDTKDLLSRLASLFSRTETPHEESTANEDFKKWQFERIEGKTGKRYQAMNETTSASEESGLELALCQELRRHYNAEQVVFYVPVGKKLERVASEPSTAELPDEVVLRANGAIGTVFQPVILKEERRDSRGRAHSRDLLRRACIPLAVDTLLGVIDIRWSKDTNGIAGAVRHGYAVDELKVVATVIATMYQVHITGIQLKQKKNQCEALQTHTERLADAMIGPATQVLHQCANIDALLERLERAVLADDNREHLIARIREIRFKTRRLPRAMRFLQPAMRLLKTGIDLDRAHVNLVSLVDEAVRDFDWDRDVKCVVTVNPVLAVNVNQAWIVEAFFNIVDNGIRAIRDKGEDGLVTISATTNSDKIQITFRDTGIGMSPEEINMILSGSSRYRTGTGVLLTRMLLTAHGGELFVESQKGSGTIVTVMLPWSPESFESSHAAR